MCVETPRIDRPAFSSPVRRPKPTPFASTPSFNLTPTLEEADEERAEIAAVSDEAPQELLAEESLVKVMAASSDCLNQLGS